MHRDHQRSQRAHKAADATNAATAQAAAAEQRRSETEAFILGKTGRAAPGVADRVLAAGGADMSIHRGALCQCASAVGLAAF